MPKPTAKSKHHSAVSKTNNHTQPKVKTKSNILDIKVKTRKNLPDVWRLSKTACLVLWKYRLLLGGIVLIYGLVNFAIVQGFSSGLNVASVNSQVASLFHGQFKQISSGLLVYALLLSSVGQNSSGNGGGFGYQMVLLIIVSLAIIWAIRTSSNQAQVRIRDAYYRGMYPLIPFIAILLVIGIELLPMLAGISIYVIVINNSIAVTVIEQALFVLLAVLLSALTLYFLSSSIFALYIATLPDMTPIKALKSAKELVKNRRWPILLRLIYLPVALIIVSAITMLPFIIFVAPIAQWLFLVLVLVLIALIHSYLYALYRELLV